jgi:hypothetical protein
VASVVSIAHLEAVEAALCFAEKHAAVTRRQIKGERHRAATPGWVAATFVHLRCPARSVRNAGPLTIGVGRHECA